MELHYKCREITGHGKIHSRSCRSEVALCVAQATLLGAAMAFIVTLCKSTSQFPISEPLGYKELAVPGYFLKLRS